MHNAHFFREKIKSGKPVIGAAISFTDPTVSEALTDIVDFLFIDAEHNPITPEAVLGHVMATKGTECAALVRVPTADTSYIKWSLDAGADGIVGPQIRSVEDAKLIVDWCRYPPLGVRGIGPRRAGGYSGSLGPDFPQRANEQILAFVMMEHVDAVSQIDSILALPGLDGVMIGPGDLSGSLGTLLDMSNPRFRPTAETIISKTRASGKMLGVGLGDSIEASRSWINDGVQFVQAGGDHFYLRSASRILMEALVPE